MTPSQLPFLVRHVIPDEEICREVGALMDLLVAGGRDPADIDLTDLAIRYILREVTYEALNLGLPLGLPWWSPTPNGDVEVIFPVAREADAVAFKLKFG